MELFFDGGIKNMFYSEEEIQKLIDNLDIVEVIGEYVNLKKAGTSVRPAPLRGTSGTPKAPLGTC